MAHHRFYTLLLLFGGFFALPVNYSYGVVMDRIERVEMDWSKMRIRYYGKFSAVSLAGSSYEEASDRALQEGLLYLVKHLPDIRAQRLGQNRTDQDVEMAHRVASSTFISNTTYFANGGVRVDLESNLARAMADTGEDFSLDKAEGLPAKHSAVVIKLNQAVAPRPVYQVVDQATGQRLFHVGDIAREDFERNLMGRWFDSDKGRDFRSYVGAEPTVIAAEWGTEGQIRVNKTAWQQIQQENPGLLASAQIAIVLAAQN